jgi:hypothetical protein
MWTGTITISRGSSIVSQRAPRAGISPAKGEHADQSGRGEQNQMKTQTQTQTQQRTQTQTQTKPSSSSSSSSSSKRKYKDIWLIEEVPNRKAFWTKIGVAFENQDGSWNLHLSAVPANGNRLQIRDPQPVDAANDDIGAQAAA